MELSLSYIGSCVNGEIVGNKNLMISGVSEIDESTPGTITFLANPLFDRPATLLGVFGGVLALSMRLAPRIGFSGDKAFSENNTIIRRTIADTNFVTTWVVAAFLLFELLVLLF